MKNNTAIVFPGQGSQSKGMLDSYLAVFSDVKETLDEASNVLGYDLHELITEDKSGNLNKTQYTQPALLAASVAMWRVLKTENVLQPKFLAGHSLGEYTALVCSGALSFADGLKLVAKRGELMQEAVKPGQGTMAAILGMTLEQVDEVCRKSAEDQVVQPANLNAPGQIVIAGDTNAVERAVALAKELGAKRAIVLPVSVPSHCALMKPAAIEFEKYLKKVDWKPQSIPVVHNFDVAMHDTSSAICNSLDKQLYSPVRWVETIEFFVANGITKIVECGPGNVLAGLNKRIAKDADLVSLSNAENVGSVVC